MPKTLKIIFVIFLLTACATTPVSDRQALILIPLSQEIALGKQAYQQTLKDQKDSENTHLTQVLLRVGQRIAEVSDMPKLDWEFRLIESKEKNAFALPGGKVAVYTGMLQICQNEAGLATVLSHEISHVIARHGAQRMSQQLLLTGAMMGASLSLRNNTQRNIIMSALGLGVLYGITLPFSRADEEEADQIGLVYMAKAGYDPEEAIRFWQRFSQAKGDKDPPEWASTHPADKTRIAGLKSYLSRAKYKYQNIKLKHGLGESFNFPADNGEPEKPKPVPGVSIETFN
ncbi:MAG: peptidase M48 family protein [Nitrospinae bacterium CG22_combo_CG10-13_8_21_14_all_47_10]|nr:MAG: peptidase M48 family protein [Nitrospinae bacterium CG22_combo_CG10-13_8_21_14_all_47_10]